MAAFISGPNISVSWLRVINFLLDQPGHESYNVFVEITDPMEENEEIKSELDKVLKKRRKQSVITVANTIFPEELYNNCETRQEFYDKYLYILPKLRKSTRKNSRGIYFERVINWPGKFKVENQIENIIKKLNVQMKTKGPVRVIYEMMIYHPNLDVVVYSPGLDNTFGFPCLSYLSFKLEAKRLHLVAVYRNHFFLERAYGNYLGLSNLLHFVCQETGCSMGTLCVLSTHAELEAGTIQILKKLTGKYPDLV